MITRERYPQPIGERGSLKWIQRLVANKPTMLTDAIRASIQSPPSWNIDWVAPRENDEWAEYRDAGFLKQLDLPQLIADLRQFWPRGGPQWDALGIASDGAAILVEAKARVPELSSNCSAGAHSRTRIKAALAAAKSHYGAAEGSDWLTRYYQYANRLAHLDFLRQRGVRAWLVFVYFCDDTEIKGPRSVNEWKLALDAIYKHLGLRSNLQQAGVINVFCQVEALTEPEDRD